MSKRDDLRGQVEQSVETLGEALGFWRGILEAGQEAIGYAQELGVTAAEIAVFEAVVTEAEQNIGLLELAKRSAEGLLDGLGEV